MSRTDTLLFSRTTVLLTCVIALRLKNSGGVDGICVLATAKNDINGANVGNWQTVLERIKGYVEKCIQQVQPKESPRYIVLTV